MMLRPRFFIVRLTPSRVGRPVSLIALILGAMTLGALTSGCEQEVQPPEPPIVVVSPAEKKDVPIFREYVGVTKASLDVEIRARVDGFVEEQLLVEGSAVEAGDLLYRIDARRYQARVKRIEASLASDRAVLAKARRDVERLRPLYEQNAASQLDFDNAVSAVEQGRAAVAATDAELEEAQLELSYTEIRAPISGMAGESQVDIGSLVGSGGQSLLTTVKQIDPIFVTFNMSALDYLNARRRMRTFYEKAAAEEKGKALQGWVHITLPDDSEYRYRGVVSFTDPQVSPETGTFAVRAVLPNPDHELLPGQYTRTRIKLEELPNAVVIPEQTLKIEQGGAYVMVLLANDTVEQRFVITGPRVKGQVVINSGLAAGERVVVEGMHRVRHGQKVTPQTLEEYEEHKAQQLEERLKAAEEKAQPS